MKIVLVVRGPSSCSHVDNIKIPINCVKSPNGRAIFNNVPVRYSTLIHTNGTDPFGAGTGAMKAAATSECTIAGIFD